MIGTDELNRHGVLRVETEQERRERLTRTYPGSGTLGHLGEPSRLEFEIALLFERHETFHAVIAYIKKLEIQRAGLLEALQLTVPYVNGFMRGQDYRTDVPKESYDRAAEAATKAYFAITEATN